MGNIISNFMAQLPVLLLGLPVILLSLSVHETAHGYTALKLGDPTARNFGRLTLNPLKHIDPIGFICMVLFHFGWANPVPINTRNFKNPRRDMALSAAAGPISNVLMALIFGGLLRLSLWAVKAFWLDEVLAIQRAALTGTTPALSGGFMVVMLLVVMLYLGIIINFSYAIFNMLPVPPLDGSRIFYIFLPPKWYFGVMKYERIIALVMLFLLWTNVLTIPLGWLTGWLEQGVFWLFGMKMGSEAYSVFSWIQYHVSTLLIA